jgi:hypothetical protein
MSLAIYTSLQFSLEMKAKTAAVNAAFVRATANRFKSYARQVAVEEMTPQLHRASIPDVV